MIKYFFRLDDVAPNMNWDNFNSVEKIFKNNSIKPLAAIIPDLKDLKLLNYSFNQNFWQLVTELKNSGWVIGQHGYQHLSKGGGGVLKIHKSGEFACLSFENQETMINAGRKIMESRTLPPDIFIAPWHSFDKNTIKALKQNDFNFISDGIALWPFKNGGLVWLPQILWRPRKGMFGLITIALHPNTMSVDDIKNLAEFIEKNRDKIGDFRELMEWYDKVGFFKKFFTHFISLPFKIFWRAIFLFKHGISK